MKLNKIIYALSMAMSMGLWSCTADEAMPDGVTTGEPIPVTITVSRGDDAQTRTLLTENEEGGLNDVWQTGDKIFAYNTSGKLVGELQLNTESAGKSKGIFAGKITFSADKVEKFNLIYYNPLNVKTESNPNGMIEIDESSNLLKINLRNQNFTTVGDPENATDLSKVDFLYRGIEFTKVNDGDNELKAIQNEDITMNSDALALVHFSLKNLSGKPGTLYIGYKKDEAFKTGEKFKFDQGKLGNSSQSSSGPIGCIAVPIAHNQKDTYVAFLAATKKSLSFEFIESESGNKYVYDMPESTTDNWLRTGNYYAGDWDSDENSSNGIEIPFKAENKEFKIIYNANFDGASPSTYEVTQENATFTVEKYQNLINENKLPARDNYICFGWSTTKDGDIEDLSTITLTDSEPTKNLYAVWTDQSKNPLRKWAETNLVYNTISRKSSFATSVYDGGSLYQWGRNDGYSDYQDAMGGIDPTYGNYKYATYGQQFYSGEGFSNKYNGNNRSSLIYTNQSELTTVTKNKRLYFINPWSKYNGVDVYYDWWPWSGGGSNWEERAVSSGYSESSPAPEGWRIPKQSDFEEIYPKTGYTWKGVNILATNVNDNLMEIKEIKNICKYAIRWDISTYLDKKILTIKAMVIPQNLSKDIKSLPWSDANVTYRIFPATGAIEAYTRTHINTQGSEMIVVRPMPFGNWNVKLETYPSAVNPRYWAVQYLNIIDAGKTNEGAYWVSDDTRIFRFRNNNGQFGEDNPNSFFGASDQPTSNAFAIRCVKNN